MNVERRGPVKDLRWMQHVSPRQIYNTAHYHIVPVLKNWIKINP